MMIQEKGYTGDDKENGYNWNPSEPYAVTHFHGEGWVQLYVYSINLGSGVFPPN
jgi:hypothetical protein